jgi:hypothetical protein
MSIFHDLCSLLTIQTYIWLLFFFRKNVICYSNITSFFRFVDKRAIYWLGIISLAHAPVHVTDFSVINVHFDEISSARIWQYKLCATFSASVNINYRLLLKVYYRICTLRHIRIEINHSQLKNINECQSRDLLIN